MYSHILYLAWNEIDTNEAAHVARQNGAGRAQVAFADRQAQGAADAMRAHIWSLCAEAIEASDRALALATR